ncbi:MAG TPA: CHAT domain-containing protein, partial [Allocoleopsis sp.]
QAMVLSNLALTYQQLGQWTQANQAIAQSLNLLQTENQATTPARLPILAQVRNNQGSLQLAQGQAEAALTSWQQATTLYQQAGDAVGVTRSLINQAQAMQSLGLYPRACNTLLQSFGLPESDCQQLETLTPQESDCGALIPQKEPKTSPEIANLLKTLQDRAEASPIALVGLNNLGSVLAVLGNPNLSQDILQVGLKIAQRSQNSSSLGALHLSLGNTQRALSHREQDLYERTENSCHLEQAQQQAKVALEHYQQAANISSAHGVKSQLNQLSLLLDVEQSLQKSDRVSVPKKQWFAQNQSLLATFDWRSLQNRVTTLPLSTDTISAQINLAQNLIRFRQLSSISQTPSWEAIEQLLSRAIHGAQQLGDRRSEANALGYLGYRYELTQNWSEAQTQTAEALRLSQAVQAWDIAYQWQWQLGRLHQAQNDRQGAIAAYAAAFNTLQTLREDIAASNSDFQFAFRAKAEDPVYRELVGLLLPLDAQASQANLRQAREVIASLQIAELENFLQEPCAIANPAQLDDLLNTQAPTAAVIYPIILKDRLEVILKLPKQDLYRYPPQLISQSEIEQIIDRLQLDLQEEYSFDAVQQRSQKIYQWLVQPAKARLDAAGINTLVFVLDGPLRTIPMAALYDGTHYLIENYAIALALNLQLQDPKPLSKQSLQVLGASLSLPPKEFQQQFAELPSVDAELNAIEQAGVALSSLRDRQFTRSNFNQTLNRSSFQVVHLATHGLFSSLPEETFLLAADGAIEVEKLDELFRARGSLRPDAIQLLVLSACETASGDDRAVLGIAGTAVRAGARSAIASLWSLGDESTATLMGEFYQQLAKPDISKAEALRQAQLALMKIEKYQHPKHWSPYILIGNWL